MSTSRTVPPLLDNGGELGYLVHICFNGNCTKTRTNSKAWTLRMLRAHFFVRVLAPFPLITGTGGTNFERLPSEPLSCRIDIVGWPLVIRRSYESSSIPQITLHWPRLGDLPRFWFRCGPFVFVCEAEIRETSFAPANRKKIKQLRRKITRWSPLLPYWLQSSVKRASSQVADKHFSAAGVFVVYRVPKVFVEDRKTNRVAQNWTRDRK